MPHIKPDIESFARIKVIGVGGSGKNAVNHMIRSKVRGVEFIAVNTDAQDLHQSLASKKIRIGKGITKGLGTGMNPELPRNSGDTELSFSSAVSAIPTAPAHAGFLIFSFTPPKFAGSDTRAGRSRMSLAKLSIPGRFAPPPTMKTPAGRRPAISTFFKCFAASSKISESLASIISASLFLE